MDTTNSEHLPEYSFSLKKIQIVEKTMLAIPRKESQINFDYDISLNVTLDPEKKHSIHFMSVSVKNKNDNKKIASISIACLFEIANFDKLVISDQNEMALPQGLSNLLNTVVIGTIRGIMYSELRGTFLDDAILPVLDPRRFQKKAE